MNDLEDDYENIPMVEVIKKIKMLSSLTPDKKNIMQMTSVLGVHLCKLQKEFRYPPVFTLDLIPIPKSQMRRWGFEYASLIVKKQGILKQFQQDGALYCTMFQEMTSSQWDAIKSGAVENLILYNAEMRDKKSSSLSISTEFKFIIDSYRTEYDKEVIELHSFLKSKKSIGCMMSLFLILISSFILIWII
jgi:hypothetical protein